MRDRIKCQNVSILIAHMNTFAIEVTCPSHPFFFAFISVQLHALNNNSHYLCPYTHVRTLFTKPRTLTFELNRRTSDECNQSWQYTLHLYETATFSSNSNQIEDNK